MSTAISMRAQHGPRFKSVLGSSIRPLCAERFFIHQSAPRTDVGAYLFQITVPTGIVAVITRVAGLWFVLDVQYTLVIDSIRDPYVQLLGELPLAPSLDYRVLSWSRGSVGGASWFVAGRNSLLPIVVPENVTFGLWGISSMLGGNMGGGVAGYYMPRNLWREGR